MLMDYPILLWIVALGAAVISFVLDKLFGERLTAEEATLEALKAEPQPMPEWASNVVLEECGDLDIKPPRYMNLKFVNRRNNVAGYCVNSTVFGEIALVYKEGTRYLNHYATTMEKENLLHELAHWITGRNDFGDGHHPRFYEELTRLCLKYGTPLEVMEQTEYPYQGDMVFSGITNFHMKYNEGYDAEDRESGAPG